MKYIIIKFIIIICEYREVTPMTEVKRKEGESFESLLRRFNNRVQMSGRMLQAKKIRFLKPEGNKTRKKVAALKREGIKEKINYMLKSGKIKEEDLRRRGKQKLKIKIK